MNKENLVVNSLRFLSAYQIEKANSGHPGLPLGVAPMAYTLWGKELKFNPKDVNWINRDRFILSAGHGSAMLYSLLHLYGYKLSMDDLKNFRQLGSLTPGHPEYGMTDGVEASTGPLGQGISMAVGMAIAESHLAAKYNKDDMNIIDHYTYSICGDGDLMEGIGYEALSLAGTLALDKLIILYDSNRITIEGGTDFAFTEDVRARMEAFGFQVLEVEDGNDIDKIYDKIQEAKAEKNKPSMIIIRTEIGYGVPGKVGTAGVHGAPLGEEHIAEMREFFDWGYEPFELPEEARQLAQTQLKEKEKTYDAWKLLEKDYAEKYPEDYKKLMDAIEGVKPKDLFDQDYFEFEKADASRGASGNCINKIAEKYDRLMGGSADLGPSNKTVIKSDSWYSKDNRLGRNIHFGVREHAMAAIGNGMALHGGIDSYVATFLVFSDYMKGAMRMSALMGLPVKYVLTHDSIGVGEDGPTHQPIEHLAMIRTIPNMYLFRPADNVETAYAWKFAIESKNAPVALALSRQTLPDLENSGQGVEKGAYIISKESKDLDLILIGTGSEVQYCIEAKEILEESGIGTRVISMPSVDLFKEQSAEYKEELLPNSVRNRISVEAATTYGWGDLVGLDGISIGIDSFGASGPASKVYEHFGITTQRIVDEAKNLVDKTN